MSCLINCTLGLSDKEKFYHHFFSAFFLSNLESVLLQNNVSLLRRDVNNEESLIFLKLLLLLYTDDTVLCIGYSMFCVGYGIYTRERSEINILDSNFLSSSYGNESHKSVGYGKYTTLNMVLFLLLIG